LDVKVRLATPSNERPIKTIAICAGSGASVVSNVKADLYFTGEMGHHETLSALASGTAVILVEHSNSGNLAFLMIGIHIFLKINFF
jgi:putative NIF3 family GTP cyclohydrolase 1 type 2